MFLIPAAPIRFSSVLSAISTAFLPGFIYNKQFGLSMHLWLVHSLVFVRCRFLFVPFANCSLTDSYVPESPFKI